MSISDLDLRQLRVVVAVADAGGFSAAASQLRLAQSSLSRTVLEVERHVGVALFTRTTRRVATTVEGEQFVAMARRLVDDVDQSLAHFHGYLSGVRGAVSVGALPSLAATLLPGVLARFRVERPDVAVEVRDGLLHDVLDLVTHGTADFALTAGVEPGRHGELEVTAVAADRFACIFDRGHRFSREPELALDDLEGEAFVHFDHTSSIRGWVEGALAGAGVSLGALTQARNIGAVAGLVGAGLGVSLVPGLVLPMTSFAPLEHRWLSGTAPERHLQLVRDRRRPLAPAAVALSELLAGVGDVELPTGCRWLAPT